MSRLASFEWCGMMRRSRPPVVPSTVRAQSSAIRFILSNSANLSSSGTVMLSDRVTASCHSDLFAPQPRILRRTGARSASRGGIVPIVSHDTHTRTGSWSSRGSGLRKASASRRLAWPVLDRQKKQSRTAYRDSLIDCHVACNGAAQVRPAR